MQKAKISPLKPTTAIRRLAIATLLCAPLVTATMLSAPTPAKAELEAEMAGVSAAVTGEITLSKVTGEVGILVESGMPVYLGDRIITSANAGMQVLLLDETVFTIGPNSDVAIDEFVYDPATGDGRIVADMAKGVMRFVTGKIPLNNPSSMDVNLPVGSIGIRGTIGLIRSMTADQANQIVPGSFDTTDANTANQLVFMAVNQGPGLSRNDTTSRPGAFAAFDQSGGSQNVTGENFGVFVSDSNVTTPTRFPTSAATFDFSTNVIRTASRDGDGSAAGSSNGSSSGPSGSQQTVLSQQQSGQAETQTGASGAQAINVAMAQMGTVNSASSVTETTSILNNNLVDNTSSSDSSSGPFTFDGLREVVSGTVNTGTVNASSGSLSYSFFTSVNFSTRTLNIQFSSISDSSAELQALQGGAVVNAYDFSSTTGAAAFTSSDFTYQNGCTSNSSAAGCSATATFTDASNIDFKLTTNAESSGASGSATLN
ncbi:FecR domain-containing protein [Thalassospira sp.]|uniref:FecR family protein n=1 Tax=Thalassospira sp. TaxID=1912094 RepID=UPI001B1FA566|nr:FecR domain-containing protein [Thalassospira sp.]MBO6809330.1 FecR domain-containing protein [Thalassospira sp.]MBO6841935.1 FecR domain-containing protein [Thalassospira sp.]